VIELSKLVDKRPYTVYSPTHNHLYQGVWHEHTEAFIVGDQDVSYLTYAEVTSIEETPPALTSEWAFPVSDTTTPAVIDFDDTHLTETFHELPAEGVKYDKDKVRMELIPPEIELAIGAVLTFGAKKYNDRNWEKGMKWSRIYGALRRHLTKFWAGQDIDEESGLSHLSHAACCIAFLVTYADRDIGDDDRA
jgi:hypothetical protein